MTRSMAVVAMAVVAAVGLVPVGVAVGVAPPRAAAAPAGATVRLLGQSTWVGSGEVFSLRLGVARGLAATDRIVVTAYPRLTDRTDFDQAADGQLGQESPAWIGQESVAGAARAPQGGVWARIPVNTQLDPADLTTAAPFEPGYQSGVYPLRVQVLGANYNTIGTGVSTFLVYSANQAGFPKLATSVTVPVGAAPVLSPALLPAPVSIPSSLALSTLTSVLAANPVVAVSLAVSPQTAEALASGSAADRATLRRLASMGRGRDELLPEPYVPVSLARFHASGLDAEISSQLLQGRAVLTSTLGLAPDPGTWVVDEPVDNATLRRLRTAGLRHLVVPDGALSPLPASLTITTYGRPTALDDGADAQLRVVGTDPTLSSRVTQPGGPVLAAEQTLAELALTQLEAPGLVRGVALVLPAGHPVSTTYLETLLHGLQQNPFVEPVTATGLFAAVPARPPTSAGAAPAGAARVPVRTLRRVTMTEVPAAAALVALHSQLGGLGQLFPGDTTLLDRVRRQFLLVPAPALTPPQRGALLAAIVTAIHTAASSVHLPGATSVTLTSLKATLPLIVMSNPRQSPHVRLTLESPKLSFRAFRPPNGTCQVSGSTSVAGPDGQVIGPTSEVCYLVLHGPQTGLRVPVEARTSGVFSLDVVVTSPDGSLTLATARDTVRSTAVSFVGIVIIVVSLLFLGIWWIRDIRSGRRARQLIRRPGDDLGDETGDSGDGEGPPGGGVGPRPPSPPVDPSEPVRTRLRPRTPPSDATPAMPVGAGPTTLRATRRATPPPAHRRDAPTEAR